MPAHQKQPYNQLLSWSVRKKQLNQIQHWQIQGAVAVRTSQKSFSATVNWKQCQSKYQINLFGPLGIGAVNLGGQTGHVVLQTSDHKKFVASNPEQLLQQQFGWHLPVSGLRYWIRGLPIPKVTAIKQFDRYHHLVTLQQQGWRIRYLQYMGVDHVDLPCKVFLDNPLLHLRIVVSRWVF